MLADALFSFGLALLLAHELDAVRAHEWRLLPVMRRVPDAKGRNAFILIHVPLIALLLWLAAAPADPRFWFQVAVDTFCIVHVALHQGFVSHPNYEFHAPLSRGLIYGTGAVGILHLLLLAQMH